MATKIHGRLSDTGQTTGSTHDFTGATLATETDSVAFLDIKCVGQNTSSNEVHVQSGVFGVKNVSGTVTATQASLPGPIDYDGVVNDASGVLSIQVSGASLYPRIFMPSITVDWIVLVEYTLLTP